MSLRLGIYRRFQTAIVEPWLLPRWMSEARRGEEKAQGLLSVDARAQLIARREGVARAWFHAASVGELETLLPVLRDWLKPGAREAVVTVLSESAGPAVARLRQSAPPGLLHAGYSPWEGHWQAALTQVCPDVFVTAKYEAWPELWASLAEAQVPLVIVSAKARRSLRIASLLCRSLGGRIPRLTVLAPRAQDARELESVFGASAHVAATGDPRWDRVQERASMDSPRARELLSRYAAAPRPWGVLAQVWPEDLAVWQERLTAKQEPGTLWVVPHRLDREHLETLAAQLRAAGLRPRRTSADMTGAALAADECLLVDEMGVLLELYGATDWAYVGGGFGVSMHSTIEPALYGLPVACGPEGQGRFSEIAELRETGQLTLVRDAQELAAWAAERPATTASSWSPSSSGPSAGGTSPTGDTRRAEWRTQAQARLGATQRVLDEIRRAMVAWKAK